MGLAVRQIGPTQRVICTVFHLRPDLGRTPRTNLRQLRLGSVTTLAVALTSIAAGNIAIGICGSNHTAGPAPGADATETELAEVSSGGTAQVWTQLEYGTDNSLSWSNLADGKAHIAVAVEYAQAAGGDPEGSLLGGKLLRGGLLRHGVLVRSD